MNALPAPLYRLLAVLLLSYPMLQVPAAYAVDAQSDAAMGSLKSTTDYLSDLEGDSDPDRLYAARVLRGTLARALRIEAKAPFGSLASLDARATLLELEDRLPGACRSGLQKLNSVAPCADILGLLDVKQAIPELQAVLAVEKRKWVRRHLEKALARLGAQ